MCPIAFQDIMRSAHDMMTQNKIRNMLVFPCCNFTTPLPSPQIMLHVVREVTRRIAGVLGLAETSARLHHKISPTGLARGIQVCVHH